MYYNIIGIKANTIKHKWKQAHDLQFHPIGGVLATPLS